jgi:hypothetical protein
MAQASDKTYKPETFVSEFPSSSTPHGSVHAFSAAERTAFVRHINDVLKQDKDLTVLPINPDTNDIFLIVRDGVLLWLVGG